MSFKDNPYKQAGHETEKIVGDRLIKYLKHQNYIIDYVFHSSIYEDMKDKWDFCIVFNILTPYDKLSNIKVDVKSTHNFTLITSIGDNSLENSKSDYIVFNSSSMADILIMIKTVDFKILLSQFKPYLINGSYDNSKYFNVLTYMQEFNLQKYFNLYNITD